MLTTERLILRQWCEADREPWRAMNADPQVMVHFPAPLTASTNTPSMAVMARIGMAPAPDEDFDHPAIPEGHPLRRHGVWAKYA